MDSIADGRGFAYFDFDRDGWQDVVLVNSNAPQLELALGRLVVGVGAYEEEFAHFVALMNNTNAFIRGATATSLRFAKNHPGTAVKALSRALSDPDPGVRECAAASLTYLGGVGTPSQSHLERMLKNPDTNVATFATNVLFRVAAEPPSNSPANK